MFELQLRHTAACLPAFWPPRRLFFVCLFLLACPFCVVECLYGLCVVFSVCSNVLSECSPVSLLINCTNKALNYLTTENPPTKHPYVLFRHCVVYHCVSHVPFSPACVVNCICQLVRDIPSQKVWLLRPCLPIKSGFRDRISLWPSVASTCFSCGNVRRSGDSRRAMSVRIRIPICVSSMFLF